MGTVLLPSQFYSINELLLPTSSNLESSNLVSGQTPSGGRLSDQLSPNPNLHLQLVLVSADIPPAGPITASEPDLQDPSSDTSLAQALSTATEPTSPHAVTGSLKPKFFQTFT